MDQLRQLKVSEAELLQLDLPERLTGSIDYGNREVWGDSLGIPRTPWGFLRDSLGSPNEKDEE